MTDANARPTRRRLLGATAAAALAVAVPAGCDGGEPPPDPTADPLHPLYRQALDLAAGHERAAAAQPALAARLAPLAADHRAHAAELGRLIGVTAPSAGASAPPAPGGAAADVLAGLRTAEQAAQRDAAAACRAAPAERAALVGSIAACRATHVEVLRRGAA